MPAPTSAANLQSFASLMLAAFSSHRLCYGMVLSVHLSVCPIDQQYGVHLVCCLLTISQYLPLAAAQMLVADIDRWLPALQLELWPASLCHCCDPKGLTQTCFVRQYIVLYCCIV